MKYVSTRGGTEGVTFEEALFSGYAKDGGLFVPESVPRVSRETLRDWSKLSFVELAQRIARQFIDEEEVPTKDLNDCIEKALSSFSLPEVVPVTRLSGGLNILELFHGRTLAFKDIALSCVGQLLQYFLRKRKKRVVIVVVTSGDTGSAAIDSVKGKEYIDIVVFLPQRGCSEIQVLQMVTAIADNVHVFKVESLTEVDESFNAISRDQVFTAEHGFMSVNSCNWARVLMQTVHYFYGYFQICPDLAEDVQFIVPCGACGNIAAGIYAREMGLPINFVCAVNSNDITARAVSKGDYSMSTLTSTLAPAMDIQYPYNIERLLYVLSGGNHELMAEIFEQFESHGTCRLPETLVDKTRSLIGTHKADDDRIKVVMRRCWEDEGYTVCPHTAIGVSYFYSEFDRNGGQSESKIKRICIGTASPAKFPEAVTSAGVPPVTSSKLAGIEDLPRKFECVPGNVNLEEYIRGLIARITRMRKGDK